MKENVGIFDLVIRAVLGIGILAYLAKDGVFHPGALPGIIIGGRPDHDCYSEILPPLSAAWFQHIKPG